MPSPSRIFRGLTLIQLTQLRDSGFNRALYGSFTNLGGGGKSEGLAQMDIETLMREVNFEIRQLSGTNLPQKVEQRIFDAP